MTWEELKEEAKKMGYSLYTDCNGIEFVKCQDLIFYSTGSFYIQADIDGEVVISYSRTPDQMLAIMKALQ